jgi:hypothetical protein
MDNTLLDRLTTVSGTFWEVAMLLSVLFPGCGGMTTSRDVDEHFQSDPKTNSVSECSTVNKSPTGEVTNLR